MAHACIDPAGMSEVAGLAQPRGCSSCQTGVRDDGLSMYYAGCRCAAEGGKPCICVYESGSVLMQ